MPKSLILDLHGKHLSIPLCRDRKFSLPWVSHPRLTPFVSRRDSIILSIRIPWRHLMSSFGKRFRAETLNRTIIDREGLKALHLEYELRFCFPNQELQSATDAHSGPLTLS